MHAQCTSRITALRLEVGCERGFSSGALTGTRAARTRTDALSGAPVKLQPTPERWQRQPVRYHHRACAGTAATPPQQLGARRLHAAASSAQTVVRTPSAEHRYAGTCSRACCGATAAAAAFSVVCFCWPALSRQAPGSSACCVAVTPSCRQGVLAPSCARGAFRNAGRGSACRRHDRRVSSGDVAARPADWPSSHLDLAEHCHRRLRRCQRR